MPAELSIMSDTCAKPMAPRLAVPPKMTSCILPPRRVFELCSPMTQRMASEIFDLPEPFGPTMAVISRSKVRRVFSGKDLKPCISNAFKYKTHYLAKISPRLRTQAQYYITGGGILQ